jgi:hypothetical protein
VGVVISSKFATLYELETIYSYEDMLVFYEIILTNGYNEKKLYDEAVRK